MHLFQKSKKCKGEAKVEIPASKTMITSKEDLSPRRKMSSTFIARKWVILKRGADYGKREQTKEKCDAKKNDKKTLQP